MTKNEYQARRQQLLQQAKAAKEGRDAPGLHAAMEEISNLDADFAAVEAANQAAGAEPAAVNIEKLSVAVTGREEGNMDNNNTTPVITAATAEYRTAWLRNLMGAQLTEDDKTALATVNGTAISAPGAIPTVTVNRIAGALLDAPILNAIDVMQIPGNVSIPVIDTVNDAAWVDVCTAATDSADVITTVELSAYKLIKTVEICANVDAMSIDAFEDWLVGALGKKIREALAKAVLLGTGSGQATGILNPGSVTQTATYPSKGIDYKSLLGIIAALPTQYAGNATFVMGRQLFYGGVLGMTTADGTPVVVRDVQDGEKFIILGYPVIVDDNVTDDRIVFGDLYEGYKLNISKPVTVESDKSVAFRSGSTVYRGMCLADGKVAVKDALVVASKSV